MIAGLLLHFFNPNARFWQLNQLIKSSTLLLLGFIFSACTLRAQSESIQPGSIDRTHTNEFSRLIVQDDRGRMKPLQSLACETLYQLGHPEKDLNITPEQWILLVFAEIKPLDKLLTGLLSVGFAVQTMGLIMRWIASGHAPWTNKYESLIYIAWTIMLSGMVFVRNTPFSLALASLLAGGILKCDIECGAARAIQFDGSSKLFFGKYDSKP